jgi:hypothetical protein
LESEVVEHVQLRTPLLATETHQAVIAAKANKKEDPDELLLRCR